LNVKTFLAAGASCLIGLSLVGRLSAQEASGAPSSREINLALVATPTASFVSGEQSIEAINDGVSAGRRTVAHYGNWPSGGTQWVEYTWPKPISTNKVDVSWWADGQGIHLPKACRL